MWICCWHQCGWRFLCGHGGFNVLGLRWLKKIVRWTWSLDLLFLFFMWSWRLCVGWKDCALDVGGRAGGIMSPSLNCRHIIATLRFQLNFQGAFFRERGMRSKGGFFQNLPEKERSISQMGKVVKLAIQNIHRLNTYLHTHTDPFTYGHAFYL